MKALLWIGASVASIATLLLITRKVKAGPVLEQQQLAPKSYGESAKVTLSIPAGWRRTTNAEVSALPELAGQANALRSSTGFTSMAYGSLTPFTASDGRTYATWIEQHYHEPGGVARPWGLHHGVTLLSQAGSLSDEWQEARIRRGF